MTDFQSDFSALSGNRQAAAEPTEKLLEQLQHLSNQSHFGYGYTNNMGLAFKDGLETLLNPGKDTPPYITEEFAAMFGISAVVLPITQTSLGDDTASSTFTKTCLREGEVTPKSTAELNLPFVEDVCNSLFTPPSQNSIPVDQLCTDRQEGTCGYKWYNLQQSFGSTGLNLEVPTLSQSTDWLNAYSCYPNGANPDLVCPIIGGAEVAEEARQWNQDHSLWGCTSLCATAATSASFAVCKNFNKTRNITYNLWYKYKRTMSVGESETVTTTSTNQTLNSKSLQNSWQNISTNLQGNLQSTSNTYTVTAGTSLFSPVKFSYSRSNLQQTRTVQTNSASVKQLVGSILQSSKELTKTVTVTNTPPNIFKGITQFNLYELMLDIQEEGCPRPITIPSQNIIMLPKDNGTCLFPTEPLSSNVVLNASTPGVINLCDNTNLGVIGYNYHHGITESITSQGKETVDSYTLSYLSIPAILIIVVFALKYQKCCKCTFKTRKDLKTKG